MPDFDANEDPFLHDFGQGEPLEPVQPRPRAIRRVREETGGHLDPSDEPARRLGRPVRSQRTRSEWRACNRGWRGCTLRSLPRRRGLWTLCHGRTPGSPS